MYIPSLHRRFYYTSRFKVLNTSGGQITLEDQMEYTKPQTIVKTLDKPVTVCKIYFIGLSELVLAADGSDISSGRVLSAPIDNFSTYVEYGAQDYS
jgi:hypothetical protein